MRTLWINTDNIQKLIFDVLRFLKKFLSKSVITCIIIIQIVEHKVSKHNNENVIFFPGIPQ